jgi:hypothetical protein
MSLFTETSPPDPGWKPEVETWTPMIKLHNYIFLTMTELQLKKKKNRGCPTLQCS